MDQGVGSWSDFIFRGELPGNRLPDFLASGWGLVFCVDRGVGEVSAKNRGLVKLPNGHFGRRPRRFLKPLRRAKKSKTGCWRSRGDF